MVMNESLSFVSLKYNPSFECVAGVWSWKLTNYMKLQCLVCCQTILLLATRYVRIHICKTVKT
jgi:hypothetical protein